MDWLGDTERLKKQPINREKAREAIELHLKATVESQDYNAMAYAMRGLNLAWLKDQDESKAEQYKKDAYSSLDSAVKYAADKDLEVWEKIKEAYTVFDDQAKLSEVETKLTEARQAQLQEMLDRSMRDSQRSGQGAPPPPGPPPTE
jgi:hypothetical protein